MPGRPPRLDCVEQVGAGLMARLAETTSARRGGQDTIFVVYVLKSRIARKSYVGLTDNVARRLKEHNSGKHFYTKRYMPWEVIYQEKFANFREARSREKYLKSTSGRRFLKKLFQGIK